MKKPVVIAGIGIVVSLAAAFAAAGVVSPSAPVVDWRAMRGTEEYFKGSEEVSFDVPDLNVNLKGSDGQRYLAIGIGVKYRLGAELRNPASKEPVDPKAPFEKAKLDVRDRLTILFSNKSQADIEGREKLNVIKQEVLEEIQAAVFPDQTGRIESVYLRQILVQ